MVTLYKYWGRTYLDRVEQPEWEREDGGHWGDEAAVEVDPGQGGPGLPGEHGPSPGQQDAQLEAEADQEAVALHLEEHEYRVTIEVWN